ncbi:hypothetical protein T06_5437 [Trichinella sp. T6]|nr:hypothetical protein T06_5437 [Trichinella sp. T6]
MNKPNSRKINLSVLMEHSSESWTDWRRSPILLFYNGNLFDSNLACMVIVRILRTNSAPSLYANNLLRRNYQKLEKEI